MDYKSAIIKGIQTIQETAGSEEIRLEWKSLISEVEATTNEAKLAMMYRALQEEICKTVGIPPEAFKARVPSGVETFHSVDEYLKRVKSV